MSNFFRWFSTKLEDGRICRELLAGTPGSIMQYKVVSYTTDTRGAGTDANVHLIMHGLIGDGQRHTLVSGVNDFDR